MQRLWPSLGGTVFSVTSLLCLNGWKISEPQARLLKCKDRDTFQNQHEVVPPFPAGERISVCMLPGLGGIICEGGAGTAGGPDAV